MSQINFGNSQPLRAKVYPQAKVKKNGRSDITEYRYRAAVDRNSTMFKGLALKNDLSGHEALEYDGEPCYVMKNGAIAGTSGRFNAMDARDLIVNSFSIPVLTALNGLEGNNRWELEEKIQMVGHIEMGNQDNGQVYILTCCYYKPDFFINV